MCKYFNIRFTKNKILLEEVLILNAIIKSAAEKEKKKILVIIKNINNKTKDKQTAITLHRKPVEC